MASDEIVWQVIAPGGFCSFKLKYAAPTLPYEPTH